MTARSSLSSELLNVISLARLRISRAERGVPLERELALYVVHGTLHLAGWDHDTDQARRRMWERERELLAGLDMLPPSDPWAAP